MNESRTSQFVGEGVMPALKRDGPRAAMVYVGPWAARLNWSLGARFANGSRWFSGWHRWTRLDAECDRFPRGRRPLRCPGTCSCDAVCGQAIIDGQVPDAR